MDFESYILKCFLKYEEEKDKTKESEPNHNGNMIWFKAPNRNPKQVPDGMWNRLLHKHIQKFHYN